MFSTIDPQRVIEIATDQARRRTKNHHEIEELAGAAILRVCSHADEVNRADRPAALVTTIAQNSIKNTVRDAARRRHTSYDQGIPERFHPTTNPYLAADMRMDLGMALSAAPPATSGAVARFMRGEKLTGKERAYLSRLRGKLVAS